MYELPLFPLNTVLFPGMPIKLHIFEERYKLMISRCYAEGQPFGIALIKSGNQVGDGAVPFMVGCTATITEMEPLPDGRMNIVAVGKDRFVAHSFKHDEPYLVGMVETFPLEQQEPEMLETTGRSLRPWVRKYLQTLADASETQFDLGQLPGDPLQLAYLASFLLNVPTEQKQDLLAIESADELIHRLRDIYRREVTLLNTLLKPMASHDTGMFSSN
ncbi:MAG: LON peptidase substrate-binding domain-containing protein [Anaerolineae bacterium]